MKFFLPISDVPEFFVGQFKTGLSHLHSVWQLFINQRGICYDNLLLLQLNIKDAGSSCMK